jgi:hypothetical protein
VDGMTERVRDLLQEIDALVRPADAEGGPPVDDQLEL